jgi:uncharacterized protein (TIGR02679 family)
VTTTVDQDLRNPALARLLRGAHEKFEARGGLSGTIRLSPLSPPEALGIDAFWKPSARRRPRRGQEFSCTLRDLDASLTATFGLTLEDVLRKVGGPLRLRPQEREDQRRRSASFWDEALAHPLCEREDAVRGWVERLRSTGGLGANPFASARGRALLVSQDVGGSLPREPPIERSAFATEMLGDPHGLDDGSAVGDRLTSQLAARDGLAAAVKLSAGERRALLQRFGVLCDPASATVLTLGLQPLGDSALEQALRLLAGTHVVLTLGQLSAMPLRFPPDLVIRLCENPAVVLRAESRLGAAASPLICTGGWPGSAVCALLDTLTAAGARLEHHGDFDWEGLAIAHWLRQRYDAQPWRFDVGSYRAAVDAARTTLPALRSSRHQHGDDALSASLRSHGVAISEEAVLDHLVTDLAPREP